MPTSASSPDIEVVLTTPMALALVVVTGLVVIALTAQGRRAARRGAEHPRLRRAGERGRTQFLTEAAGSISRHLDELPPEPKPSRLVMDLRLRLDVSDPPDAAAGDGGADVVEHERAGASTHDDGPDGGGPS